MRPGSGTCERHKGLKSKPPSECYACAMIAATLLERAEIGDAVIRIIECPVTDDVKATMEKKLLAIRSMFDPGGKYHVRGPEWRECTP